MKIAEHLKIFCLKEETQASDKKKVNKKFKP